METQFDTSVSAGLESSVSVGATYRGWRARAISLFGPLTVFGGFVWAILQPYRLTLLHPRGQGFWWLVVEPPLLVAAAGVFFALVVARPLINDLEADGGASR